MEFIEENNVIMNKYFGIVDTMLMYWKYGMTKLFKAIEKPLL